MTATTYNMGRWPIHFDGKSWRYTDELSSADQERICKRCGLDPTIDMFDPCLGYIKKCKEVCGKSITKPVKICG